MRATSAVGCVRYVFVGIVVALLLVVGCFSVLVSVQVPTDPNQTWKLANFLGVVDPFALENQCCSSCTQVSSKWNCSCN